MFADGGSVEVGMLDLTHEFIVQILGTRRAGGTEAAGQIQRAGVIRYTRGHINILDRRRLEAMSCECYPVVRKEFDRLAERVAPARIRHARLLFSA